MGQLLMHSGKLSTHAPGLINIAPNTGKLRMNIQDMERLGLQDGTKVRLISDRETPFSLVCSLTSPLRLAPAFSRSILMNRQSRI